MAYERLEECLGLQSGEVTLLLSIKCPARYRRVVARRKPSVLKHRSAHKKRKVWAPCPKLGAVQRKIADLLIASFEPHSIAHAYAQGRSIHSNASQHVGKRNILHIDLVNFFGSIQKEAVLRGLGRVFFDFSDEDLRALADLCYHGSVLAQGSPSSAMLSNLICVDMDMELLHFARSNGCTVTRYSDDICFSTDAAQFPTALVSSRVHGDPRTCKLGGPLCSLIERHGFKLNLSKVRLQTSGERQKVTGDIVNQRLNAPKELKRRIRAILYQWKMRGLDEMVRSGDQNLPRERMINSLRGLIDFVGQAAGRDDRHYKGLLNSFHELLARDLAR
ncbi:MAG: reverse transcriptase family protein [Sphingomonadaceae bacterium]